MAVLTPGQIERLHQIIRDASTSIAVQTMGYRVTPEERKRLQAAGYLQRGPGDLIEESFRFGQAMGSDPATSDLDYPSMVSWVAENSPPLSGPEQAALAVAQTRAGSLCVGLGNRYSSELGRVVVDADAALAAQTRAHIQDAVATRIAKRQTVGELKTALGRVTNDWARDWDRIAATETQMAHQEGFLEATTARFGEEELLAKVPEPGACKHCMRLYTENGKPIVRPASWWREQGVSNAGRKTADWKPVLGAMHPWCRCQLVRVPPGWGFDENGDLSPIAESEKSVRGELSLRKAGGPFIGPRGGKWADPEHTIHWDEASPHEKGKIRRHDLKIHEAVFGEPIERTYYVKGLGNGRVSVSRHEDALFGQEMSEESFRHFRNDLAGKVPLSKHADPRITAVVSGKAKFLGKGDDGLAFKVGDDVVKVSTTVPYHPDNPGHRTPEAAVEMLRKQSEIGNKLADMGIKGIQRSEFIQHGDKGFQIKPWVEIPEKWSREDLDEIQRRVMAIHDAGYAVNDAIQAGRDPKTKEIVLFDVGKAAPISNRDRIYGDIAGDQSAIRRLYEENGEEYVRLGKSEGEEEFEKVQEHWNRWLGKPTPPVGLMRRHLQHAVDKLKREAAVKLSGKDLEEANAQIDGDAIFMWMDVEDLEERQKRPQSKEVKKSIQASGGPFIGPRGGKWADAKHTIPWKGNLAGRESAQPSEKRSYRRDWFNGSETSIEEKVKASGSVFLTADPHFALGYGSVRAIRLKRDLHVFDSSSESAVNAVADELLRQHVDGDLQFVELDDFVGRVIENSGDVNEALEELHDEIAPDQIRDESLYDMREFQAWLWDNFEFDLVTFSGGDTSLLLNGHDSIAEVSNPIDEKDLGDLVEKARKLHGRMEFRGLQISIENKKGSLRHWYDPEAKRGGSTRMIYPYGYIRMSEGADGEHVDVYVGPDKTSDHVFIVHQLTAPSFLLYDEDKVMLGFHTKEDAEVAYKAHYDDPRFLGWITEMPFEEFKEKVLERSGELIKGRKPSPDPRQLGFQFHSGGPFIGPRGGKWADAKHTIPWKREKPPQSSSKREKVKSASGKGAAKKGAQRAARFVYGAIHRPIESASVPKGFEGLGEHEDFGKFGTVTYSRPLTEDERRHYSLIEIPSKRRKGEYADKLVEDYYAEYAKEYLEEALEDRKTFEMDLGRLIDKDHIHIDRSELYDLVKARLTKVVAEKKRKEREDKRREAALKRNPPFGKITKEYLTALGKSAKMMLDRDVSTFDEVKDVFGGMVHFSERLIQDLLLSRGLWASVGPSKAETGSRKQLAKLQERLSALKQSTEEAESYAENQRSFARGEKTGYPDAGRQLRELADRYGGGDLAAWEAFASKQILEEKSQVITKKLRDVLNSVRALMRAGFAERPYYTREVQIGDLRVEFNDQNMFRDRLRLPVFMDPDRRKSQPPPIKAHAAVTGLLRARALLEQKGLGHLWKGRLEITHDQGIRIRTGPAEGARAAGLYHIGDDHVSLIDPSLNDIPRILIHELGHRYYYQNLTRAERKRFADQFGAVEAVTEYGTTNAAEDFAEVFQFYVRNKGLTKDQLSRFKTYLGKSLRPSEDRLSEAFSRVGVPASKVALIDRYARRGHIGALDLLGRIRSELVKGGVIETTIGDRIVTTMGNYGDPARTAGAGVLHHRVAEDYVKLLDDRKPRRKRKLRDPEIDSYNRGTRDHDWGIDRVIPEPGLDSESIDQERKKLDHEIQVISDRGSLRGG